MIFFYPSKIYSCLYVNPPVSCGLTYYIMHDSLKNNHLFIILNKIYKLIFSGFLLIFKFFLCFYRKKY